MRQLLLTVQFAAEDESPVPQYATYWEKVAGHSQSHVVFLRALHCPWTQEKKSMLLPDCSRVFLPFGCHWL